MTPAKPDFEIQIDPARQLVQLSTRVSEFDLRPTTLIIPWNVLKVVVGQVLLLEGGATAAPAAAEPSIQAPGLGH